MTRCVLLLVLIGMLAVTVTRAPHAVAADDPCPVTAASTQGWGEPNRVDEFDDPATLAGWHLYDGPGHVGNGRRTPDAIGVTDGMLTINGDSAGNSGGMAWLPGQLYGRWEVCIQSPPSAAAYHSVLLLWPDAEDWPVGGEIDFMEIRDPARQLAEYNLHYGPDNRWEHAVLPIDATAFHSWAVEWTPDHVVAYVDGVPWWTSTDPAMFPPRAMHLCMQLDDFGGDVSQGGRQEISWARQYPWPTA